MTKPTPSAAVTKSAARPSTPGMSVSLPTDSAPVIATKIRANQIRSGDQDIMRKILGVLALGASVLLAGCGSPGTTDLGNGGGSTSPAAASTSGDCFFGANGADIEVGIGSPTQSCAQWTTDLAGDGQVWYPITQMIPPGESGSSDQEAMQATCDLTDGNQEFYVEDAGGEFDGDSLCSGEEQNGWTPESSPGPLAVLADQQEQAQASASAAASQSSANAAAEQQAQGNLATVKAISLTSDLNELASSTTQTNTDLATTKSDAAAGPNGPGGNCSNLEGTVDSDVEGTIDADMEGSTESDLEANLMPDIASARSDVKALQSDLSGLSSAGLPAPSGASAAITAAQNVISSAVSAANGDIAQVDADVTAAYQVADGIATGTCDGPGNPPSLIPAISL